MVPEERVEVLWAAAPPAAEITLDADFTSQAVAVTCYPDLCFRLDVVLLLRAVLPLSQFVIVIIFDSLLVFPSLYSYVCVCLIYKVTPISFSNLFR